MSGEAKNDDNSNWKMFIGRHWMVTAIFAVAGILLIIGGVYVFHWFAGDAQSTGLVPSILGLWTMGHVVSFILNLVLWELIFIGIPAAIIAITGWLWWRRLPDEERKEYNFFNKGSNTSNGGSGVSLLLFIGFALKIYIDGNWDVAISTWTLEYVVESMITVFIWAAIIFGIPIIIGVIVWMASRIKTKL